MFFKDFVKENFDEKFKIFKQKILKIMIKNIIPTMFQLKNLRII